jgi:hypothetical protein
MAVLFEVLFHINKGKTLVLLHIYIMVKELNLSNSLTRYLISTQRIVYAAELVHTVQGKFSLKGTPITELHQLGQPSQTTKGSGFNSQQG